ncbi:MAG: hypothetical protein IPP17_03820 [Bacteroidetes bacterium]|nr:hypothetical protein [Bacteroidota bacterium]
MQDEFKSTAAFVPPSITSLSTMVFGNGIAYKGFYAADEEDIDRTVAYLESPQVMDSLDKKFNLYERYGIDRASKEGAKRFEAAFKSNMKVSFTSNSVVSIECWDAKPQHAKIKPMLHWRLPAIFLKGFLRGKPVCRPPSTN